MLRVLFCATLAVAISTTAASAQQAVGGRISVSIPAVQRITVEHSSLSGPATSARGATLVVASNVAWTLSALDEAGRPVELRLVSGDEGVVTFAAENASSSAPRTIRGPAGAALRLRVEWDAPDAPDSEPTPLRFELNEVASRPRAAP